METARRLLAKNQLITLLVVVVLIAVPCLTAHKVNAGALTTTLVRFDRIKVSTFTSGLVCATPATTAIEAHVQVTFPATYVVSTSLPNWTVSTASTVGWPSGAVAWLGIGTATAAAGQVVTFPSTDLVVGTQYCFNWTNTTTALETAPSTSSSNTGTVLTQTTAPATIDSGSYTAPTITDDQILVTATVPQAFSFTLSGNSDLLGALSTGVVTHSPTPRTVTIATNAKSGWYAWARSAAANGGLTSTAASYTVASTCNAGTQLGTNTTLSAGSEGYNTGVTSTHASGTGTISVNGVFNGTGTSQGGGLCGTLQTLASSNGTASNDVLTLTNNVGISNTTPPAGDYTDTITVTGAGKF